MKKLLTIIAITSAMLFSSNVFALGTDFLVHELIMEKTTNQK